MTKEELQERINQIDRFIGFENSPEDIFGLGTVIKYKTEKEICELALAQLEEKNELKSLKEFKSYFEELYGQGLEVANWHQNGDTEPFDSFFESALDAESKALQEGTV